jgi:alkylation response protein AidB-like acyl-CoA dehydrogenase
VEFTLTGEQKMVRDMVRKFAQNEVKPICVEYDKKVDPKECFPWELLKKASKLGFRTIAVPSEYGGGGVTEIITYLILIEELAAGDHGFASCIRSTVGLSAWMDRFCSKDQKDEFFPEMVRDDTFTLGVGITEPNAGTDNILMADVPGAAMQTYAQRKGDEYIINGMKHFISNGGMAKLYLVHARSDRKLPLNECRSIFLVPADTPGFSIGKIHNKVGRRTLMNAELIFQDACIPARYLVGKEGQAASSGMLASFVPFLIPACSIGTLRAFYEAAVDYARIRIQGGKPIIQHQLIAAHLAETRVRIEAAKSLLYRQAWSWQHKYDYDHKLTVLLRTLVDQLGGEIVFKMHDVFGGVGSDKDLIIEKYVRDLYTSFHGPSIGQGLIKGAPDLTPTTKPAGIA